MKLKSIIKCSATWCMPCKQFAPIFEEVSNMEEYKEIQFSAIDIDRDENGLVEKYNIRNVPTVVFLDEENNVIKKLIGGVSKTEFIKILNDIIKDES